MMTAGTLWGVQPSFIKASAGEGLSEVEALAIVLIAVAGILGAYLAAAGRLLRPVRSEMTFLTLSGTAEYAAPLLMAFLIAPHIDAGLLTLIMSTTPVFTVALAAAVGSEALNRYNVSSCILGILAMGLIVIPENALPAPEMLPWCLAAFAIPIVYSCGSVYVSHAWPKRLDTLQVAFGGAAVAGLILAPAWIVRLAEPSLPAVTPVLLMALGALTLAVVLEMVLYFYLLKTAGPVFTSFTSFVMILSGFLAGALIFGESPSAWIWGSVALFSLSLILTILGPHSPPPDAAHGNSGSQA